MQFAYNSIKFELWHGISNNLVCEAKPQISLRIRHPTLIENGIISAQQQWRIPLGKNLWIQVRLSLIFPLILVRFAWGLKQIPRKNDSNMTNVCDFRTKIWFKSY